MIKLKELLEKAPKGWEGTVKSMKKDSDIDNPWALAHWMKKKGYKSRKKESVNEANASVIRNKLLKKFGDDPLYKDFIIAKTPREQKKALDTLKSIRGGNAVSLMQKYVKKLQGESVNEAKPKSFKFNFKCMECGKSFIKSLKKSLEVKCPKCTSVDIELENINEAKFSKDQIEIMRKAYGTLNRMNPSSPTYKKFIKFLEKLPKDQLKQLANAKIKFVSILAKNRLRGESVNEGGMGILDKDQTDVLHAIVMKNKSKNSKAILSIAMKDRMFKGIDKKELLGYIEGAKQFVKYMSMGRTGNESVNEEVNRKAAELIKRMEKERAALIRQYIGFGPQAGSDKLKLKIIKYDKNMLKLISAVPKESVDEGFGGELKGKDKEKFEKERKENAEVLGYKLAGKSDINEELTDADIKVGDAYKTTHSGLMVNFVYKKESRGGATTIEYQFKPQYGASGFMSVGSGPAKSVDGWGKHKKVKVTSKMKKEMIKTLEDAMKSKYKNSEEVDVLIRNGERLSNVLSWVKARV